MLRCKNSKFWLQNPTMLFCNFDIVPLESMKTAEQMNTLTRLVVIIFVILILLQFKYSVLFLLLSLLMIIILYFLQIKQMDNFRTESYNGVPNYHTLPKLRRTGEKVTRTPQSCTICDDSFYLDKAPDSPGVFNNPNYVSKNQRLVGGPNPKTLIPPVVTPPSSDLSYWRTTNLVDHSAINSMSQIDLYQSGYFESDCCPSNLDKSYTKYNHEYEVILQDPKGSTPLIDRGENLIRIDLLEEKKKERNKLKKGKEQTETKEEFEYTYPYLKTNNKSPETKIGSVVIPNEPGMVNVNCGYNPDQLFSAGLPTNYPAGNCEKDPAMKIYNENLFTQTIQPGVYTRNEINEPINSNIGISFQQQFEPTTITTDPDSGDLLFTEHDPRIIEPIEIKPNVDIMTAATEANVYDPRFSGYGTSYRSFTERVTGQPRFYYDDIDAIRMPNYIVRSDIDNQPFADKYGPIPEGDEFGNKWNADIRTLADDAWLGGSLQFRTELQERLMRKNNANAWQQRQAPIRTGGQRMLGGMSCK